MVIKKIWDKVRNCLPSIFLKIVYPYRDFMKIKGYINYYFNKESIIKNYDYKPPIKKKFSFRKEPKISIIMQVYNVNLEWLKKAVNSVKNQYYQNWELCIVDDALTNEETKSFLKSLTHPNIKIKFLRKNKSIVGASNEALRVASGEYVAFLDKDDELTSDALFEVVRIINEYNPDFIYSDEDKISPSGDYVEPIFRPDFNPDFLLSHNYIVHLCVYKKSLVDKLGGLRECFDGSQDYDLMLRFSEKTDRIFHIPKVLYHWRKIPGSTAKKMSEKPYIWNKGKEALIDAIKRRNIKARVIKGDIPGTYRVKYKIKNKPLVSIIIPFRDESELLDKCVSSILDESSYDNFEIICINNQSTDRKTLKLINELGKDDRISFFDFNEPFNFSKIVNFGVSKSNGEHIVLCNNDVEIITPDWIQSLLRHSQRENVGVVGCKLLYPNNLIQHTGIIVNGKRTEHFHKFLHKDFYGYLNRLRVVSNFPAVTAALCMFKKSLFNELDGFDEKLSINYNDVDFCFRALKKDYRNVFTPYCEAYHKESYSRGLNESKRMIILDEKEKDYLMKKHKKLFS